MFKKTTQFWYVSYELISLSCDTRLMLNMVVHLLYFTRIYLKHITYWLCRGNFFNIENVVLTLLVHGLVLTC